MKAVLASALLLVVSVAAVRSARADGCHAGGGGGGGGGSGGGGGGGGASIGIAPACTEVSDVVGHQHCSHFGASWEGPARMPALTTEVGFFTRELRTGFDARGVMEHDTGSFAYQVASGSDRATATGASFRLALALPAHIYLGAEAEIGGVSGAAADVVMTEPDVAAGEGPSMTGREKLYVSAGGVAGVRGRLGRAALSAELVAGARDLSLSVKSQYGACFLSDSYHRSGAFVEPRVRLDFWLTPWVTIAGFAGSGLDTENRMIGASLAFHLRAFDRGL